MSNTIRVTAWSEFRQERDSEDVKKIYPDGMNGALAAHLNTQQGIEAQTAILDDPDQGLSEQSLENTDVLLWWAHVAHHELKEETINRVQQRVLSGMGLIVLHSAHWSRIFMRLMGTNCSVSYRCDGERERIWNCAPGHEITQGIGEYIDVEKSEMYGEPFDIPEPDKTIFISWFEGGEVFRSGCAYERGNGRIFYFKPGHEGFPIYHNPKILQVITNAVRWAKPRIIKSTAECTHRPR